MSAPTGPAHRSVANIRSPSSANSNAPASPHTPLRTISSAFGSPSSLRAEEDTVILEFGSRHFRVGFAGDAVPRGVISFGPDEQRRAGDYSKWALDHEAGGLRGEERNWSEVYELWRPDLRGLDLGLVQDKIDRAVRDAYVKYLLIDSRPRRINLVIPSALPLPLLSTTLDTIFTNFQPPTISLMSAPVLTTVAAGLRSALVIDIGWAETVVTAVYEYREVQCSRSVRAMKRFQQAFSNTLTEALQLTEATKLFEGRLASTFPGGVDPKKVQNTPSSNKKNPITFDVCEEVAVRMAWCKPGQYVEARKLSRELTPVEEEDELRATMRSLNISGDNSDTMITIPLTSTHHPKILQLPFSKLAEPCENALFAGETLAEDLDDDELPLHLLAYRNLLHLPVDIRSMCMARIIFVGGGSHIPGLKKRVLDEIGHLINHLRWDPVKGKAVAQYRNNPKLQRTKPRQPGPTEILEEQGVMETSTALLKQEHDPIEQQLKKEAAKGKPPIEAGHLRIVESLGAWAGGSLLSQLKIPAVSMVEREQWLQHGAAGASKAGEVNVVAQHRQSMGPGAFKAGDRSSWTLGIWG